MTTHSGGLPLAVNPRFAAHLRLLRALNAMERARAATAESRELLARTRLPWVGATARTTAASTPDDATLLRLH